MTTAVLSLNIEDILHTIKRLHWYTNELFRRYTIVSINRYTIALLHCYSVKLQRYTDTMLQIPVFVWTVRL